MRMSVPRFVGMSLALAMLGFTVACAPTSNPEPYPERTAETTPVAETPEATATAAAESPAATPEATATETATPATGETATPAAGETASPAAGASKEIAPTTKDNAESVAKAKAEAQAIEKKERTAATWEFTITDSSLIPANPKPVLVDDVTFKITNNAKEDYIFKLEGIAIEPVTVAAGKSATCKGIKFGPGGIVASAIKASSENKNVATSQAKFEIQPPQ